MTPSPLANGLNSVFAWFDDWLLSLLHQFSQTSGGFFTPWAEFLGALTDNGVVFLAAGVILFFLGFQRRGLTLVGAVGLAGALALVVKTLVARPRPFLDPDYHPWWAALGVGPESGWAFPSGHTTTAAAAAVIVFLWFDKRWSWVAFVVAAAVGLSRCYLLAHYPSDVVAGLVLGGLAGAGVALGAPQVYRTRLLRGLK